MIRFHLLTIFPQILDSFFDASLLSKAIKKGIIKINIYNLRDYTADRHKSVDDKPYGGGAGMVMKIEPIFKALKDVKKKYKKARVILFSPRGRKLNQKLVNKFSKKSDLIFIAGRYEGIDERVNKLADEVISIGDYILSGGELAAAVLIESITRLLPAVVGKKESLRRPAEVLDFPQYTRPEVFSPKKYLFWRVPKVLLSGDHRKIEAWRRKHVKMIK